MKMDVGGHIKTRLAFSYSELILKRISNLLQQLNCLIDFEIPTNKFSTYKENY
jgi:hypothetical protein